MPSDWVKPHKIRKSVDKEVFEVVEELVDAGWRIRKQGHAYRIYCPCDDGTGRGVSIPGSSGRAATQARRLRRNAEHCPEAHELMK